MKRYILILGLSGLFSISNLASFAQSTDATNAWNNSRFLGFNNTNGANPLTIRTNNITRMYINGATGATAGFIGIGTTNPISPLSINGLQQLNSQGWNRAISISNSGGLLWENSGGKSYFMAHPSSSPNGNWYAGAQTGIGSGANVDLSNSKVLFKIK